MFKAFVLGVVATVLIACGIGYLAVTSGLIPANADGETLPLETWAASTSLHATLDREAPKDANPVALTDANLLTGVQLYADNCVYCHGGAKGKTTPSGLAKGEYPPPPQLADAGVEDDPQGHTFWKIKHAIRWTGMPSWKYALNDQQIWTLALFLKHMDKLPPTVEQAWQKLQN